MTKLFRKARTADTVSVDIPLSPVSHPVLEPMATLRSQLRSQDEPQSPSRAEESPAPTPPVPSLIKITPATPLDDDNHLQSPIDGLPNAVSNPVSLPDTDNTGPRKRMPLRRSSKDSEHHKGKKVQQVQQLLKSQVHKGREGIKTVQKKMSRSGGRRLSHGGVRLYRSNSEPGMFRNNTDVTVRLRRMNRLPCSSCGNTSLPSVLYPFTPATHNFMGYPSINSS